MNNPSLIKNFSAGAVINPYRAVKLGSADHTVIQAAAATDQPIGVSNRLGADAGDARCDVVMGGIAEIEYGGTVTRGTLLVADSVGRAVAFAAGAGTNNGVIGIAMVSGVVGDIGQVLVGPGQAQG